MGSYKQGKKGENNINREIEVKKWNDHFKKLYLLYSEDNLEINKMRVEQREKKKRDEKRKRCR